MQDWINYLTTNPLIGAVVLAVLILFIFMVVARLLKWAIISFILLALAIGITYKVAQPKKILERMQKGAEQVVKDVKSDKVVKEVQESAEKAIDKITK